MAERGEVLPAVDGDTHLEILEGRALTDRCAELERNLTRGAQAIVAAWGTMAAWAFEYHERRGWEALNPDGDVSLEAVLAKPELAVFGSTSSARLRRFRLLVAMYRELVVKRGVPFERLQELPISKVQELMPRISTSPKGAKLERLLADIEGLGYRDLRDKYGAGKDPDAPLNAADEPARVRCATCGSWVDPKQIAAGS